MENQEEIKTRLSDRSRAGASRRDGSRTGLDLRCEHPAGQVHHSPADPEEHHVKPILVLCLLFATSAAAIAQQAPSDNDVFAAQRQRFAAAYNRGDLDAMMAAFTEDAVRVTPSGVFQGRDAIRRSFQDAVKMGLHDYTVRRLSSWTVDKYVFNTTAWTAKVGEQQFHGYGTSILVLENGQSKIKEETVVVAVQ
jgi:hypothetical protein